MRLAQLHQLDQSSMTGWEQMNHRLMLIANAEIAQGKIPCTELGEGWTMQGGLAPVDKLVQLFGQRHPRGTVGAREYCLSVAASIVEVVQDAGLGVELYALRPLSGRPMYPYSLIPLCIRRNQSLDQHQISILFLQDWHAVSAYELTALLSPIEEAAKFDWHGISTCIAAYRQ